MKNFNYLPFLIAGIGLVIAGYVLVELQKNTDYLIKPAYAELGKPFYLKLNQTARIMSERLNLSILKLVEDSRCPENVECVWEGRVVLLLEMQKDNWVKNFTISSDSSEVCENEYCVKLISIEPQRKQDMKSQDYSAILVVFKLQSNETEKPGLELNQTGFCGFSTYGECVTDRDCMVGGCSGQVCQSKFEEPVITTCEWKECYDTEKYDVQCRCIENKCQWYPG
jgi:eight-cysteine-cluster-containing protein